MASGHRATVVRSRIDLHVHSPKFNLHTVLPHIRLDPESAQPESQRHQDTAWEALATVMRSGIDLHVNPPKYNLHATHPSRSRERKSGRKHKGIRASGYSNEKRNRFCMCTHLNLISTLFFHTSVSIQRVHNQNHKGIRILHGRHQLQ